MGLGGSAQARAIRARRGNVEPRRGATVGRDHRGHREQPRRRVALARTTVHHRRRDGRRGPQGARLQAMIRGFVDSVGGASADCSRPSASPRPRGAARRDAAGDRRCAASIGPFLDGLRTGFGSVGNGIADRAAVAPGLLMTCYPQSPTASVDHWATQPASPRAFCGGDVRRACSCRGSSIPPSSCLSGGRWPSGSAPSARRSSTACSEVAHRLTRVTSEGVVVLAASIPAVVRSAPGSRRPAGDDGARRPHRQRLRPRRRGRAGAAGDAMRGRSPSRPRSAELRLAPLRRHQHHGPERQRRRHRWGRQRAAVLDVLTDTFDRAAVTARTPGQTATALGPHRLWHACLAVGGGRGRRRRPKRKASRHSGERWPTARITGPGPDTVEVTIKPIAWTDEHAHQLDAIRDMLSPHAPHPGP